MIESVVEVLEADLDEIKAIIVEKVHQRDYPLRIYHRMEVMPGGSRVFSNFIVGSDKRVFGKIQNAKLLKKTGMLTEEGYKVWFVHIDEESKNMEKFLPKLFEENADAYWKGK